MEVSKELFGLANELYLLYEEVNNTKVKQPLDALNKVIFEVSKSFSGSWLGYHAYVYYEGLSAPPSGAHFSQEWGLRGETWIGLGSTGAWCEYEVEQVETFILNKAQVDSIDEIEQRTTPTEIQFSLRKADLISILMGENATESDRYLASLIDEANKIQLMSPTAIIDRMRPRGHIISRDMIALGQSLRVPPHINILARVISISSTFAACKELAETARKAASHLERRSKNKAELSRVGTNIFIGHGRSGSWRELKDFLQDRLRLPWDEFNRVPVAGVTNITRLSEMLDAAAIAFLVMTAEDELADGAMQARMNVIHEAGLFQGRLGFARAIILLEDGCEEFSNISGLGQIRFSKGRIDTIFEHIRQVLEREGIISEG